MPQVRLNGWREGLNKVQLTRLLQSVLGLSLSQAKSATDQLTEGQSVSLPAPDLQTAERVAREAVAIGAIAVAEPDRAAPAMVG